MSDSFQSSSKWLFRALLWTAFLLVILFMVYKAAFRHQVKLLVNCLDAASVGEKMKTRLEAVDGYARCVSRNEKQASKPITPNPPRCKYAGMWSSKRSGVEYFVTLNQDGSFIAEPGPGTPLGERAVTGAWTVANDKMVWAYDSGPVWPPDINPITNDREKKFELREVDGATTTFIQMSREGAEGC